MTKIFRFSLPLVAGPALALIAAILIGADPPIDPEFARLQALPKGERERLWKNLQHFDKLTRTEQEVARNLDHRIAEMENPSQKAHYLAVLRRYHLWFEGQPATKRDEILKAAPDDRMALVSKFMADEKDQAKTLPPNLILHIADLGSFSPVDVAVIYKVWQTLDPASRTELETVPLPQFRNQISKKSAKSNVTPEGLLPAKYKEADWVDKIERRQRLFRVEQITKGKEVVREEIKRHMAINLYFFENAPRVVSDDNLALFLNQLPGIVRATYDIFSPEEIRRRLSISYRLVYPDGEIPPPPKPGKTPAGVPSPTPASPGQASGASPAPSAPFPTPAAKSQAQPAPARTDTPF